MAKKKAVSKHTPVVGDVGTINFGDKDSSGDFKTEEMSVDKELNEEKLDPTSCDYDWSPFVLKQLKEDEIFDGNPTVDGLRRIACSLLGPIIAEKSEVLQMPCMDNEYRATVRCTIEIDSFGGIVSADGVADDYAGNTDKVFAKFPVATAETRAEGRALRKLLKLRKGVADEEVCGSNDEDENKKITNNQLNFIDKLCNTNRLDINIKSFINSGSQQYEKVTDIAYETSIRIVTRLSEYQRDKDSIPDNIKSYDPEWRKDFS